MAYRSSDTSFSSAQEKERTDKEDGEDTAENPGEAEAETTTVSLRVFAGTAIVSPGTQYKAIVAHPKTSSTEVIRRVLERYGEQGDPKDYELHFVRLDDKTGKVKRQPSFARIIPGQSSDKFCMVLEDDMCPVLVADWYAGETRRFELHKKSSKAPTSPEKKINTSPRNSLLDSFRRNKKDSPRFTAFNLDGAGGNSDVAEVSESDVSERRSEGSNRGSARTLFDSPQPNTTPAEDTSPTAVQRVAPPQPASPASHNTSARASAPGSATRPAATARRYESLL